MNFGQIADGRVIAARSHEDGQPGQGAPREALFRCGDPIISSDIEKN